jgi:hypothetical protein
MYALPTGNPGRPGMCLKDSDKIHRFRLLDPRDVLIVYGI